MATVTLPIYRSRRRARTVARTAGQVTVVSRKSYRAMLDPAPDPAPRLRALVEDRKARITA